MRFWLQNFKIRQNINDACLGVDHKRQVHSKNRGDLLAGLVQKLH